MTCTTCGGGGPFRPQRRQCEPCRLAYLRQWRKERKVKQRPTALTLSSGWVEENIDDISIRLLREEFESNPPQTQAERLEYVRELRRKRPNSYLAKHARRIYGI